MVGAVAFVLVPLLIATDDIRATSATTIFCRRHTLFQSLRRSASVLRIGCVVISRRVAFGHSSRRCGSWRKAEFGGRQSASTPGRIRCFSVITIAIAITVRWFRLGFLFEAN